MKTYTKTLEEIRAIENERREQFWTERGLDKANRFHFKNGIYFVRKDRDITIMKIWCRQETTSVEYYVNNCEVKIDFEITVDPYSWASIVASMSKDGESGETFQRALDFHGISLTPKL